MKKKLRDILLILTPSFHCYVIFFGFLALGLIPAMQIYLHADDLGYFWLVFQIGHIVLLSSAAYYLHLRKMIREVRMYLQDDEAFFELYPRERRRVRRAKQREEWLENWKRRKVDNARRKEWARLGL
jgi:hypothetical protein